MAERLIKTIVEGPVYQSSNDQKKILNKGEKFSGKWVLTKTCWFELRYWKLSWFKLLLFNGKITKPLKFDQLKHVSKWNIR